MCTWPTGYSQILDMTDAWGVSWFRWRPLSWHSCSRLFQDTSHHFKSPGWKQVASSQGVRWLSPLLAVAPYIFMAFLLAALKGEWLPTPFWLNRWFTILMTVRQNVWVSVQIGWMQSWEERKDQSVLWRSNRARNQHSRVLLLNASNSLPSTFVNLYEARIVDDPQHILCAYYNCDTKHWEKCSEKKNITA